MIAKEIDSPADKKQSIAGSIIKWFFRRKWIEALESFPLTDLTPNENAHADDRTKTYFRALRGGLENERVTNIAITGHYGCGKSSILRTYEKHFAKYRKFLLFTKRQRFLNISLATFGQEKDGYEKTASPTQTNDGDHKKTKSPHTPDDDDDNDQEQRRINYLVEHSILQQIIYQVPKKVIPRSRFKRIGRSASSCKMWFVFLLWGLCLGSAIAIFHPSSFSRITAIHPLVDAISGWPNTLLSLMSLGTVLIPVYLLFGFINTGALRRFRLKACELEMADDKDPSMLNKHLDEILYFFDATDYDVVVIEDLDRFGTPGVFTKLREINTLINRNRMTSRGTFRRKRKRVVFIYAIKDEMFTGEERTKFFDLIIPVVPVVNYDNSKELLKREFEKRLTKNEQISLQPLLNDISLFIADMRLLFNIVNEFAIYRNRLKKGGLNDVELLALMVYKNIMPKDFANLQMRKGLLYEYFKQKEVCRNAIIEELERAIEEKRQTLANAHRFALQSADELRALYVFHLQRLALKKHPEYAVANIQIDSKWVNTDRLLDEKLFAALICSDQVSVQLAHINAYGTTVAVAINDVENAVDSTHKYQERAQLLAVKGEHASKAIEDEIRVLEKNLTELKHAKLAHLLDNHSFSSPDAKEYLADQDEHTRAQKEQLLKLLLRQGYIKEDYEAYLSYFYEGTLSNKERVFVMAVKNGHELDPDYELEHVDEIVENILTEYETTQQATRNIYILNYLLKKRVSDAVISQFKSNIGATDNLSLLLQTPGMAHCELIQTIFEKWPEFWDYIATQDRITEVEKELYLSGLIKYASPSIVKQVCNASNLNEYISSRVDFIHVAETLDELRVNAFLDVVQPQFGKLSPFHAESSIAKRIYQKGWYEVNVGMVSLVYRTFIDPTIDGALPTFSQILAKKETPLYTRIMQEQEVFAGELSTIAGALKRENAETAMWLLNNDDISHDLRLEMASGLLPAITHLDDIDEDEAIWRQLFDAKAIMPSWDNVWLYLTRISENELDQTLIKFIRDEEIAKALGEERIKPDYLMSSNDTLNLGILILETPQLNEKTYGLLMRALPEDFKITDLSTVNSAAVPILIARRHVVFTPANYELVRTKSHPSLAEYVKNNLDEFYEAIGDLVIDGNDLSTIISVHKRKRKKAIVEAVLSHGIPDRLTAVANTLGELFLWDHSFAESMGAGKVTSILVAVRDLTLKIDVLTMCIPWLEKEDVAKILASAGGDYAKLTEHGPMPSFPKNERIEKFADALEAKGVISKIMLESGTIRLTTFRG